MNPMQQEWTATATTEAKQDTPIDPFNLNNNQTTNNTETEVFK